jgi:opacity protein-like surface antigen
MRFRSSIFNASAVGIDSSVTYFTNEWFGIEGDVATAFAPDIYDREHVKLLVYGAGPKIAWQQNKWEPWMHAIVGGAHEQPQTAGNSKNAFAVEAGGGADYRFNPRLSGRLEADWVHTSFFSQSQNNFKLMGGVVFHF